MAALLTNWLSSHFNIILLWLCILFSVLSGLLAVVVRERISFYPKSSLRIQLSSENTVRLLIFFLGAAFATYVALLIAWENFTNFDDDKFFPSLANAHQWYVNPIWPDSGRFFPLGHQEFYLLSFLSNSVEFYQLFAGIQLAVLLLLVTLIFNRSLPISLSICIAIISTPAIVIVFLGRVYTERNMVLLLGIMIWGSMRYRETSSIIAFILTSLSGFIMLFYKETAFLIVGGWALILILMGKNSSDGRRLRMLAIPAIVGASFWFLFYIIAIYPQFQHFDSYLEPQSLQARFESLHEVWVLALFLALVVRFGLLKSVKFDLLWDAWLLPIFASVLANIILSLTSRYYSAPAALLSWLYVGHVAQLCSSTACRSRAALAIASLPILCGAAIQAPSSFTEFANHKEFAFSKAETADFVYHFYVTRNAIFEDPWLPLPRSRINLGLTIQFPAATQSWSAYEVALFAEYLRLKYNISNITIGLPRDQLGSRSEPCVSWLTGPDGAPIVCHYGLPISSGDLVLIWGNGLDSQLSQLRQQGCKLLYTSEDVGFWKNTFHIYVLVKE